MWMDENKKVILIEKTSKLLNTDTRYMQLTDIIDQLVTTIEQLQKDYDHLRKSFKFQNDSAVRGWDKVIELEREIEQLKNPQIWTNDGDL
jgi:phage shock protein A